MKCYYEELGVERDASESEIKTAYRKLALRWHPDKNLDCLEEAKERFQLIQQAYEVLSDPQERAWYDNHREEILRGRDSNYTDHSLDVFPYFTSSCYKGYGDDAKGFFEVYRNVFEQIATEDIEFYVNPDDVEAIPKFGNSKSSYDEVVAPFYAYWSAYCTRKSYAWLCPYNVKEYRDRRIIREIEKEMKKVIQKARKERNDEVRNLVSFVRKRDPRVQKYKEQLEQRAAENRRKQEQNRLEQFRRRKQEVEEMKKSHKETVPEGYEEKLRQLAQQYGQDSTEDDDDDDDSEDVEEEEYMDDLYCVACNKSFKNSNAFANHESSKKHKDNVQRMRSEMQEEEELYRDEEDVDDDIEAVESIDEEDIADDIKAMESIDEEDVADDIKAVDSTDEFVECVIANLGIDENAADDMGEQVESEKAAGSAVPSSDEVLEEVAPRSSKASKKNRKNKKKAANKTEMPTPKASEPESSDKDRNRALSASDDTDWANRSSNKKAPRKNKKSQRQSKAKAKPPSSESSDESDEDTPRPAARPTNELSCAKCGAEFPSKNKLFAHLKETQHSIYLPKAVAKDDGTKQKKVKGKKKK